MCRSGRSPGWKILARSVEMSTNCDVCSKNAQRTIDADGCKVRIRLTHRKSIPSALSSAGLYLSFSPATSGSVLISFCAFSSHHSPLWLLYFFTSVGYMSLSFWSQYLPPGLSISTSACLCLSSDTAYIQINYLRADQILFHMRTPTHTLTHTL